MNLRRIAGVAVVIALSSAISVAAILREGKYSGVVIFDRWGGCTLYNGVFVMYVSEAVKDQLRGEAGKCVRIDATQVEQPMNPGDGLIKRFTFLGPAPADERVASAEGLKITAVPDFKYGSLPQFVIRVENVSDKPLTLRMDALAPTMLAAQTKPRSGFGPSDGPSVAVVTRQAFWNDGSDRPRMQSEGIDQGVPYRWWVTAPRALEKLVELQPKAAFDLHVSFRLPQGEYDFLAGYGGTHDGQCIASNLIDFDVRQDGSAVLAKAAGR